jgi:hypothetical protein
MDQSFLDRVIVAAREEEAEVGVPWCAVSLYLRLYPGTGYHTVESGVSAAGRRCEAEELRGRLRGSAVNSC